MVLCFWDTAFTKTNCCLLRSLKPCVHTAVFKMGNKQGATVQHRELCSVLSGGLDGRSAWRTMIDVSLWLSPFATHLRLSQHCLLFPSWASLVAQMVKNLWMCLQCRRPGLDPWVGKIPWRRQWFSTPVFFPWEPHGQRSLADYSPWGRKRVRYDWVAEYTLM